jgi:hypothetical protein
MGRTLGFGIRSRRNVTLQTLAKFPEIHSFVEIGIGGRTERESVAVNEITPAYVATRPVAGMLVGAVADFLYINPTGKFRFSTVCTRIGAEQAYFKLPTEIKTIENFADRRTYVRVACVIPVQWRYAPDGQGYGEFLAASMMDISRGGASLVVGRELKVGSQVEVRFTLKSKAVPVVEVCQVMRAAKIETSDRNAAGIRFIEIDHSEAEMLSTFVHERQTQRRDRGIV